MGQAEIRERVTRQIAEALEKGGLPPWKKMWGDPRHAGLPVNARTGAKYSGVNVIALQWAAVSNGWAGPHWATFQQWKQLGCIVRPRPAGVPPGQWGTRIVFCKPVERTRRAEDGEEHDERYLVLRESVVFHAAQVEGAVADRLLAQTQPGDRFIGFGPAEEVIRATGARIVTGDRAAYLPAADVVVLPPRAAFETPAEFYATAAHELVHWTGHPNRLNRLVANARFGSDSYAAEELVAELGAAFVCAQLNVPDSEDTTNTQAYLASWLRVLRADHHAIFRFATQASRAADYLLALPAKVGGRPEPALAA